MGGWMGEKNNMEMVEVRPFPEKAQKCSCRETIFCIFPDFVSQLKVSKVMLVLENRGSARRSEVRVQGYNQGKLLTWRLNNGCCNIQAQPWEVISANIKLLQHTLKLSLLQGNLALAIHQLGQRRQDRE